MTHRRNSLGILDACALLTRPATSAERRLSTPMPKPQILTKSASHMAKAFSIDPNAFGFALRLNNRTGPVLPLMRPGFGVMQNPGAARQVLAALLLLLPLTIIPHLSTWLPAILGL